MYSYFNLDGMLVYRSVTIQLQHENLFGLCQFKKNFFYLLWNSFILSIFARDCFLSVSYLYQQIKQLTNNLSQVYLGYTDLLHSQP